MAEAPKTDKGVIVGTIPYMSPEQAEGKNVDARSDIFSFGALLYEMLTGRRAFQGDSKMSTLAAILNLEPEPIEKVAPDPSLPSTDASGIGVRRPRAHKEGGTLLQVPMAAGKAFRAALRRTGCRVSPAPT